MKHMILRQRNRLGLIASALLFILFPLSAFAQQSATDFVRQQSDEIIRIINTAEDRDERVASLQQAVGTFIDFPMLAQRSLALHWDDRTAEEQAQFTALLQELIETSYATRLGDERVEPGSYTVVFEDERERRGRYTVEGRVSVETNEYFVAVRLIQQEGSWRVYDVVTDDVSLLESYAESFDEIIRQDGWDALLERMQEKIDELNEGT